MTLIPESNHTDHMLSVISSHHLIHSSVKHSFQICIGDKVLKIRYSLFRIISGLKPQKCFPCQCHSVIPFVLPDKTDLIGCIIFPDHIIVLFPSGV